MREVVWVVVMANDRIFLRCDKCGDDELLLIYTMNGAGLDTYVSETPFRISSWLERHQTCHPNRFSRDLAGVPGFKVVTESTSDEIVFGMVPCDHPEWKPISAGPLESTSTLEEVTRNECTTCGHKVTHIKRLVAREHFRP